MILFSDFHYVGNCSSFWDSKGSTVCCVVRRGGLTTSWAFIIVRTTAVMVRQGFYHCQNHVCNGRTGGSFYLSLNFLVRTTAIRQ